MAMFTCNFTLQALSSVLTANKNISMWFDSLQTILPNYNITSKNRVAAFIAQTALESTEFTILQENLNYSAERLVQIYPTHFTSITASQYAEQPEKIANKVYASRFGNSDEASGDGFKYSGKGLIQCTFKDNYLSCSKFIYNDDRLVNNPELLIQPTDAINSAVWFWQSHNLSTYADAGNFSEITLKINGALGEESQRLTFYNKLLSVL